MNQYVNSLENKIDLFKEMLYYIKKWDNKANPHKNTNYIDLNKAMQLLWIIAGEGGENHLFEIFDNFKITLFGMEEKSILEEIRQNNLKDGFIFEKEKRCILIPEDYIPSQNQLSHNIRKKIENIQKSDFYLINAGEFELTEKGIIGPSMEIYKDYQKQIKEEKSQIKINNNHIKKNQLMKQLNIFIITLCSVFSLISCGEKSPIHDRKPAEMHYAKDFPLEKFKAEKNIEKLKEIFNTHRKTLTSNILDLHPRIKSENNIRFLLGSGYAEKVKSGDGKFYSGKFKNEIIIILDDQNVKKTLFLACGNEVETQSLQLKEKRELGNATKFLITIQEGESLATYFPSFEKWGIAAQTLGIPIKDSNGNIVSEKEYLTQEKQYYSFLFPGDQINLYTKTLLDKNGFRIDFKQRQKATFEQNLKNMKKKISSKSQKLKNINKELKKFCKKKLSKKERKYTKELEDNKKTLEQEISKLKQEENVIKTNLKKLK